MRLHRLTLRAVGPFPDEHTIDLAALGAGGLFLLEGPTGSGKSTVIDAIVFALYGHPAGTASSVDRLVSSHAEPGVEPFVDLVLETAAGIYRVRRSPEHDRPKHRGSGTTREPAKALLWRLTDPDDPAGQPLSTRVGEADAELTRVVGLTRAQFVQTVVLPQGEFAAFLKAAPDERRPLLQRLFGTDIYQRMQEELATAAREARRSAERARESVLTGLAAVVRSGRDANGPPDAGSGSDSRSGSPTAEVDLVPDRLDQLEEMAAEPEPEKVRALVDDVVGSLRARVAVFEATEGSALARADAARAAWETARALDARLVERETLEREHAAVSSAEAEWARTADRLDEAARAVGLRPFLDAAARARSAASQARTALEEATARAAGGADADLAAPGVDVRGAALTAAADRGALTAILEVERELPARRRRLADVAAAVLAATARVETVGAEVVRRPTARSELTDRRASLAATVAAAGAAALELEAAERARDQARLAAATASELTTTTTTLERAVSEATLAVEHEATLRRSRLAGLAGELAAALEPGRPCAVCGSPEHPAPAAQERGAVTVEDVEAAEAIRIDAEAAVTRLGARRAALDERLRGARDGAGGRTPEAAHAAVVEAAAALAAAREAAAALGRADAELAAFDAATAELETERLEAATALVAARRDVDEISDQVARATDAVAEARGEWPTVAAREAALLARAAAAEQLDSMRHEVERGAATLRDAEGRLAAACRTGGFEDEAAAVGALLDAEERRRLQAGLDDHRRRTLRVTERLAAPEVAELVGCPRPDVAAADRAHLGAQAAAVAATRATERARAHLAAVERDARVLDAALAAEAQVARTGAPLLRMAALATAGDGNERRTTLATYVLLRRFEDVVAAANDRLSAMSDGRFTLARIDEREGGVQARRAGLGLVVEDHLTGDRRTPRTLSGGETFYVSLCLALGLADVVSAEAGGVDLGTLVIDEGFGSLDPATLDAVMGELVRLRDGGRVVAIVSHVEELKQRIPDRLEVRRRADGASTLRVRA